MKLYQTMLNVFIQILNTITKYPQNARRRSVHDKHPTLCAFCAARIDPQGPQYCRRACQLADYMNAHDKFQ